MSEHYKFEPGDQVRDLTVPNGKNGVVVKKHDAPDAYYVRLEGALNDVIIHARNLERS